jgi:enoyl-CoA hydratase
MQTLVEYRAEASFALLRMDDGKRNALSLPMLSALSQAFDRAESERLPVLLMGRSDVFSAGFDLTVLRAGGGDARAMFMAGFALSRRMLSFPYPVLAACSGHAVAMGLFLLLSADYRLGAAGSYKLLANEVALGLTLPASAVEICRQRLAPAHFQRVTLLSELYAPEGAIAAGILDRVVEPAQLESTAQELASGFAKLNMHAHATTKQRIRAQTLAGLDAAMQADEVYFRQQA